MHSASRSAVFVRTSVVPLAAIAIVIAIGLGPGLGAQSAQAQPLDVSDLTPRAVQLAVPGTSTVIAGSYGPGGPSQGVIQISAAEYERYLDEVGDQPGGVPVPGSFSGVTLTVDLNSLEVVAAPITGQVDIMTGPFADLVRTLGTDRVAGSQTVVVPPSVVLTIFCDGPTVFGPCDIVPGAPFDPVTGEFEMVGDDTLTHPDIVDPRLGRFFASNLFRALELQPRTAPGLGAWSGLALGCLLVALSLRSARLRRTG